MTWNDNRSNHRRVLATLCAALCALLSTLSWAEPIEGDPNAPAVAEVLGTPIRTGDPEEMRYRILGKLTDRYAAERGIEVEPEEIDAYVEGMARLAEQNRTQRQARRAEMEERMKSSNLSDEERKALSAELDSLDQLARDLDTPAGGTAEDPETRQARRTVAAAFIRQWKINKALYDQYDGRIVFQQGGPEPLDAYREFLEEQKGQGAFEILNEDFGDAFWGYYRNDAIHSFYAPGSEEERQAFETPWWLSEPADGQ